MSKARRLRVDFGVDFTVAVRLRVSVSRFDPLIWCVFLLSHTLSSDSAFSWSVGWHWLAVSCCNAKWLKWLAGPVPMTTKFSCHENPWVTSIVTTALYQFARVLLPVIVLLVITRLSGDAFPWIWDILSHGFNFGRLPPLPTLHFISVCFICNSQAATHWSLHQQFSFSLCHFSQIPCPAQSIIEKKITRGHKWSHIDVASEDSREPFTWANSITNGSKTSIKRTNEHSMIGQMDQTHWQRYNQHHG